MCNDQIAVAMDMMQKKKDATANKAEDEQVEVDGLDLMDDYWPTKMSLACH